MDKAQIVAGLAVLTWDPDPSLKNGTPADLRRIKRDHVADVHDLFDEFVKLQSTFD